MDKREIYSYRPYRSYGVVVVSVLAALHPIYDMYQGSTTYWSIPIVGSIFGWFVAVVMLLFSVIVYLEGKTTNVHFIESEKVFVIAWKNVFQQRTFRVDFREVTGVRLETMGKLFPSHRIVFILQSHLKVPLTEEYHNEFLGRGKQMVQLADEVISILSKHGFGLELERSVEELGKINH